MKISELKKLYKAREENRQPGALSLSPRILNILWLVFSSDQLKTCVTVDYDSVCRFETWVESGVIDDALS